ncbi:MAG: hypothetical protein Q7S58_14220 [Candidatus Binatus sp.]|uniref:hypothetical protein n=1 Tax=Candidatus Binatus sp. TaxID=2811406 RepID=UPI002723749C|nr:hypothetical protein [Candidatus Binatus sp.]MDO8433556.1 hypothetical protein [Candidatus Binatus sp.]
MQSTSGRVADWDNLFSPFRKAKKYKHGLHDVCDELEFAEFELSLVEELNRLRHDFLSGEYKTSALRLLPIPKKPKDGNTRMRQFFELAVRDQIAWIAVANVIGPNLDGLMPPWVYGYRLYRTPARRRSVKNSSATPSSYTHWQGELYQKF